MSVIRYTKYNFNEPSEISGEQFLYLKKQLSENPGFIIDPNYKTTLVSHFRKTLIWFLGASVPFIILYIIYKMNFEGYPKQVEPARLMIGIPLFIAGIIAVFTLARVLLEGPSFATYIIDKNNYFERMKLAIKGSPDFQTFHTSFYRRDAKTTTKAVLPMSAFDLLTRILHWLDLHYWKVFLIVAALFLLKKYVLKT